MRAWRWPEADLQAAEVRSPITGRVLRIQARPGERVGDKGILEVGNTDVMYAVAEVYEEDVGKVHAGQAAKVRVPTLGVRLSGEVVTEGPGRRPQGRSSTTTRWPIPTPASSRSASASSPQDSPKVAGLSNARAEVVIDVSGATK